jgi:two-component system sensor histidine kinase KdpD
MSRRRLLRLALPVGSAILAVGAATVVVVALEGAPGVPNASAVYLVAVAAVAIAVGTAGAILTAVLAVLTYDFLFTDPLHTLIVADPGEWLNLVLLLFVAVTVGELAALQRRRAEVALAPEREARALVTVSRALATRESTADVLPPIADALAREAGMETVWISLGADEATERVAAAGGRGGPLRRGGTYAVLHHPSADGRVPADGRASRDALAWTQVREPVATVPPAPAGERRYRVRMEADGRPVGSIWAARPVEAGPPDSAGTRLLAVTADQVAQALAHDRLAEEARRAAVARESDALKSALLESVSHDLRTPLASIRAYAGTLMDQEVSLSPEDARASAAAIDREAQRLNRLVANLLDLGRIEGGALRAAREVLDLEDVVSLAVDQVAPRAGRRDLRVEMGESFAVLADPVLLEEAVINLLDNAVRHTPDGTTVRVGAIEEPGVVRLTVEDSGPGVPEEALPRLFEKFYRPPQSPSAAGRATAAARSRSGTGIGLAVVRGLVQAQGGSVQARRSRLGGLAIDLDLPAAGAEPAAIGGTESGSDAGAFADGVVEERPGVTSAGSVG